MAISLLELSNRKWGSTIPTCVTGETDLERLMTITGFVQVAFHTESASRLVSEMVTRCWEFTTQVPDIDSALKACKICYDFLPRLELEADKANTSNFQLKFDDGTSLEFPGYFKTILSRASPFFRNLFFGRGRQNQAFELHHISAQLLEAMLDIALKGESAVFLTLEIKMLAEFVHLATLYKMTHALGAGQDALIEKIQGFFLEDWNCAYQLYSMFESDQRIQPVLEAYFNKFQGKTPPVLNVHNDHELDILTTGLMTVYLRGPSITDQGIATLSRNCSGLRSLEIDGCRLSKEGLAPLGRITHLRDLTIRYAENLEGDSFGFLVHLIRLESLTLEGCPVTDQTMTFLSQLHRLARLSFNRGSVTYRGWACLARLFSLSQLHITECDTLTDESLGFLPRNLRILSFKNCTRLTPAGLPSLSLLQNLDKLDLSGTSMLSDYHPSCLKRLRVLDLSRCKLTSEVRRSIFDLQNLEKLILSNCDITDNDASLIGLATQLQVLDISGSPQVTNAGLVFLEFLVNLIYLNIQGCKKITEEALDSVAQLKKLRRLILDRAMSITEIGLAHLAKLSNLENLTVWNFQSLSGLSFLRQFRLLNTLHLFGRKHLSTEDMTYIAQLPRLRLLRLNGPPSEPSGIMQPLVDKGVTILYT